MTERNIKWSIFYVSSTRKRRKTTAKESVMVADKEIITHSGHDTSSQKIIELFCSGESIIVEHDLVFGWGSNTLCGLAHSTKASRFARLPCCGQHRFCLSSHVSVSNFRNLSSRRHRKHSVQAQCKNFHNYYVNRTTCSKQLVFMYNVVSGLSNYTRWC